MIITRSILNRARNIIKNKTIVNGSLFSIFSFINKGLAFLLLIILANFILPSDYGYLSLFTTIMSFLSFIIALSTEGYLGVAYFKEGFNGVRNTISGVFAISTIVFIILVSILVLWGDTIELKLDIPLSAIYIAITITFFTVFFNLLLDYERLKERVWVYGFLSCSNALLNLVFSILLVKALLMGWQGRVYAQLICYAMFGIIGIFFFIRKRFLSKPIWNYVKVMLFWGIPLIPHLATSFVRQGCDRYVINYFYGIEDVGLFSFGLTIASIIVMLGNGFNQSNSVEIYKILSSVNIEKDEKVIILKRQRILYWKIYAFFCVTIIILGYLIIPMILPKYSNAIKYFVILSFYGFFFCIYFIYTNYLFYYNKTRHIMYITFSFSILHLCLSLLLTRYSLYITALLYVMTQAMVAFFVRFYAKRCLKQYLWNYDV